MAPNWTEGLYEIGGGCSLHMHIAFSEGGSYKSLTHMPREEISRHAWPCLVNLINNRHILLTFGFALFFFGNS